MGKGRKVHGKSNCEVCGKHQEQSFEVYLGGERHVFDSFECATFGLTPKCATCGCTVLGPEVLVDDILYCSDPCASLGEVERHGWLMQRADH